MQGTRVWSLVRELKPHTATPEPTCCKPQSLCPTMKDPTFDNRDPLCHNWDPVYIKLLMFRKFSRCVEAHISWEKGTINRIESWSFLELLDTLQSSISLTTQTLGRKLSPWSISSFPLFKHYFWIYFFNWQLNQLADCVEGSEWGVKERCEPL